MLENQEESFARFQPESDKESEMTQKKEKPVKKMMDQVLAKQYLTADVFPKLEVALNSLLETIDKNGEFENYIKMLADREFRERREKRRRDKERQRLAEGDAFESGDDSLAPTEEESDEDSYGSTSDDEAASHSDPPVQNEGDGSDYLMYTKKSRTKLSSKLSDWDISHRFNALRFLAFNLK